jgi:hypothetical protein
MAKYPKTEVRCESYTNEAGSRGRENTCFLVVVGVEKFQPTKHRHIKRNNPSASTTSNFNSAIGVDFTSNIESSIGRSLGVLVF